MSINKEKIAIICINKLLKKHHTRNLSDIARILKTSRQKVSMLMKEKNKLSNYLIFKISDELNMDFKEILIISEIENAKNEDEKNYWLKKHNQLENKTTLLSRK